MIKLLTSCILACSLISGTTFASGDSNGLVKNSYYQDKYDLGKRVLETKILCSGCPLDGTEMTTSNIESIAPKLNKGAELYEVLSKKERKATRYFLRELLRSYQ